VRVEVSGPGEEGRRVDTINVGTSYAITLAARADRPGTWYVRVDDRPARFVERHDDKSITIRGAGGTPS
jgi:hypothetical protein